LEIQVSDAAIAASFAAALGHGEPFTDIELTEIRALAVAAATSLTGIERCPSVETLVVEASDVTSLEVIAELPQLRSLRVIGCPLTDISALAHATQLEHLELLFTFVEDLEPITKLANLRHARLLGAPWSDRSFLELRPRLLWGDLRLPRRPILELGTLVDWRRSRTAWDGGLRLVAAVFDGVRPVCVRPGLTTSGRLEPLSGSPITLSSAIAYKMTTDQVHKLLLETTARSKDPRARDLASHRVFGDACAARAWIDDAAGALGSDADHLRTFVSRFPDAVFFREDEVVHDAWQHAEGFALPPALASTRRVLAGAWADELAALHVDAFAGSSPREDEAASLAYAIKRAPWSALEMPGLRVNFDKQRFTIAQELGAVSTLGMARAGTSDVLEWSPHETATSDHLGYPVYRSPAELLGHITKLVLDDDTAIGAVEQGAA